MATLSLRLPESLHLIGFDEVGFPVRRMPSPDGE